MVNKIGNMKIRIVNWHPVVVSLVGDLPRPLIKFKKVKPKKYRLIRLYKVIGLNVRMVV